MPEAGFHQLYQQALQEASALAMWRVPGQEQAELWVQFSPCSSQDPQGHDAFAFYPFVQDETYTPYWIKAEAASSIANRDLEESPLESSRFEQAEAFPPSLGRENYIDYVNSSVAAIQKGSLQKTVAAGTATLPLPDGFNGIGFFKQLCHQYPNAFVSMVRIQGLGSWIGASPELLLSREQNLLRTMALAGTRSINQPESWTRKEHDEQGFVRRFIEELFKKYGLQPEVKPVHETPNGSQLLHLVNDIEIPLPPDFTAQKLQDLLADLHPTPAVGGVPQKDSIAWIRQNEAVARAYYSGYLGPRQANGDFSFFVNLRCMQWQNAKAACLHAGAGITGASVAEKEWDEINKKMQVLGQVLQNTYFSQ